MNKNQKAAAEAKKFVKSLESLIVVADVLNDLGAAEQTLVNTNSAIQKNTKELAGIKAETAKAKEAALEVKAKAQKEAKELMDKASEKAKAIVDQAEKDKAEVYAKVYEKELAYKEKEIQQEKSKQKLLESKIEEGEKKAYKIAVERDSFKAELDELKQRINKLTGK